MFSVNCQSSFNPSNEIERGKNPMKIPKELHEKRNHSKIIQKEKKNAIKLQYPVHTIKCECCDRLIPCPCCEKKDLLRGWNSNPKGWYWTTRYQYR